MANAAVDTGHGATITLSSSGESYNWNSIDAGESTLEPVETTHLGSGAKKTFMPGDVVDEGEVTIPYQHDSEAALPAEGLVQTLTITLPTASGQSTPATLVGTGFVTRVKRPNLQTNQLQDGQIVFKFDGLTGPTYTAAT